MKSALSILVILLSFSQSIYAETASAEKQKTERNEKKDEKVRKKKKDESITPSKKKVRWSNDQNTKKDNRAKENVQKDHRDKKNVQKENSVKINAQKENKGKENVQKDHRDKKNVQKENTDNKPKDSLAHIINDSLTSDHLSNYVRTKFNESLKKKVELENDMEKLKERLINIPEGAGFLAFNREKARTANKKRMQALREKIKTLNNLQQENNDNIHFYHTLSTVLNQFTDDQHQLFEKCKLYLVKKIKKHRQDKHRDILIGYISDIVISTAQKLVILERDTISNFEDSKNIKMLIESNGPQRQAINIFYALKMPVSLKDVQHFKKDIQVKFLAELRNKSSNKEYLLAETKKVQDEDSYILYKLNENEKLSLNEDTWTQINSLKKEHHFASLATVLGEVKKHQLKFKNKGIKYAKSIENKYSYDALVSFAGKDVSCLTNAQIKEISDLIPKITNDAQLRGLNAVLSLITHKVSLITQGLLQRMGLSFEQLLKLTTDIDASKFESICEKFATLLDHQVGNVQTIQFDELIKMDKYQLQAVLEANDGSEVFDFDNFSYVTNLFQVAAIKSSNAVKLFKL